MDKFSYHEVLDRTHVFASLLEDHLLSHPVIENSPELKQKVEMTISYMGELYQLVGQIMDAKFEKE